MSNARTPALKNAPKMISSLCHDQPNGSFSCRLCGPNRPPRAALAGHQQQAVADGQRVGPDAVVRQPGLGEQPGCPRVGDVEHAEVGRGLLVGQVEVAAATVLQHGGAFPAPALAAQVVPAQAAQPLRNHVLHHRPR
jgi:hypothetical protein